jgi:hypothetical protein
MTLAGRFTLFGRCEQAHAAFAERNRAREASSVRRVAILGSMPTLAVIGAGPKGIAIAAKARALAAAGLEAPRVVLVEGSAVAGNWSGRQGYTNGLLPLGTPPEKTSAFPTPTAGARPRAW